MKFPIYRKYKGIDVWFKILSLTEFVEYKKMGQKILTHHVKATIFPEQQFIRDMIECYENRWVKTTQKELDIFLND
ncbi:MAG TPA: hypothetical protein EYG85_09450 [Crocinitomix sp.]|nr:hypothetical protein [Crocinitomix sp.]